MDRKLALAAATAVVLTVSAGTAAIAANLGLLSTTTDGEVGQLQPTQTIGLSPGAAVEPSTLMTTEDEWYEDDDRHEDDDHDDDQDDDDEEEEDDDHDDGHDDDD
jgi:hypothetical protein